MAPATCRASTWTGPATTMVSLTSAARSRPSTNPASTVFNQALGINNSDETVGYYAPTVTGSPGDVSYSQKGGVFTPVTGLPANFNNQAVGIN